jgi:hypothetical protein
MMPVVIVPQLLLVIDEQPGLFARRLTRINGAASSKTIHFHCERLPLEVQLQRLV